MGRDCDNKVNDYDPGKLTKKKKTKQNKTLGS